MIYKNTRTGAVIDSPCLISGGDWVDVTPVKKVEETAPIVEENANDEVTLEDLKVDELIEYAAENNIDLGKAKKKDEIIAAISASEITSEE